MHEFLYCGVIFRENITRGDGPGLLRPKFMLRKCSDLMITFLPQNTVDYVCRAMVLVAGNGWDCRLG